MRIGDIMVKKEDLTIISINDTVKNALERIQSEGHLSLPVIEGNKFKGSISIYYIYKKYYKLEDSEKEDFLNSKVSEYLRELPAITTFDNIETISKLFSEKNIPFIPVVDNDEFKGIVTQKSIFKEHNILFGFDKGTRLSVIAQEIKGRLAKLTNTINKNDGNIISMVVSQPQTQMNLREIVVRVDAKDINKIVEGIKEEGFRVSVSE